ncbi:DUF523 domain-containing protein [Clostridium celatum]|uniref:Uncharacterized protein n=1 Tax=Clostridium celatum DSM 1785 TaxID=545697 RepID=L1Q7V7_9CLOT|nr:DUF523 domain-containing protein [Clostridium celatum]EKY24011.1 hypothetical protein HMPREF0216_02770 [Clostridium celatum DSM 1785]MCE9655689.1 DUF523 domain-containing protein [Clostridium celatum]MDU3724360.1 DUF523 domain-containing protein [Clostridium celatum]MDU6295615.1 DUF523 domain-containing protein [Clostridium celatum]MDY3360454.1 DUF523 domain-containing protein [Clostridium celatum]
MYIISACLCGVNCKYNGLNNYNEKCNELFISGKAILVCPEQLGGLSTPRVPSELQDNTLNIIKKNGKILNKDGEDVTENFLKGAREVATIAKKLNIKKAILKEGSPSCGVNYIYDGTFTGNKIKGNGITTELLKALDIEVISEEALDRR